MQRLEFLGDAVLDLVITLHLLSEAFHKVNAAGTPEALPRPGLDSSTASYSPLIPGGKIGSNGNALIDRRGRATFGDAPM